MSTGILQRHFPDSGHHDLDADAALLDILTGPTLPTAKSFARRDAALDPLLIAAAAASGPNVTRNHYHHDFFPGVMLPEGEGSWDWTKWSGQDASKKSDRKRLTYVSRQAPRRQRLHDIASEEGKENKPLEYEMEALKIADDSYTPKKHNLPNAEVSFQAKDMTVAEPTTIPQSPPATVDVKCMARTRIPTPHVSAFLHLYHNNRDAKEHLAIVIDPAQFSENPGAISAPPIRSRSLDAVWDGETEMDRITRGAYVGRLSPTSHCASDSATPVPKIINEIPSPLIRIHSECFTGETVGSMRCDCGEQLDEAIRLISQPISVSSPPPLAGPTTIPGRGVVVYLRQEGRGIGLLSKIRAYNLQDLGHDTVTANLMLGHQADERGYEIAGAILRDLGLGDNALSSEGVRVLTNNPDKVQALQAEGVRVVERVPMIPRSWQKRQLQIEAKQPLVEPPPTAVMNTKQEDEERAVGSTPIGGKAVYGEDLDKYLRTKVLRMGHILPLWMEE
ncbi:GTP cyclohydrolase II-domain-containing protein [Collybia nuda]|uniref:GTP cyclohydrolase II n=1 Tax=Collybia nuda TaxID=64659 RepID=A0A9P5YA37_9AGAR|nr:GTP cyclohydrolase II-domain-containing protein [Collybia nuda]